MVGTFLENLSIHARPLALGMVIWSAAVLVLQRVYQWYPAYFAAVALWLVLASVAPLAVHIALRQLASVQSDLVDMAADPDTATKWSEQLLARALSNWRVVPLGLVLAVFGFVNTDILAVPWTGLVKLLFLVPIAFFFCVYGALAGVYAVALQWVWGARSIQPRFTLLRLPRIEVMRLHRGFFNLMALGTILYAAGLLTIWISPGGPAIATEAPWGRLWVFPPAGALIGFFLIFQLRLHLLLRDARDRSLLALNDQLEVALTNSFEGTGQGQDDTKRLLEWRDRIWSEPVWPLDLRAVLATVLTLMIPTIEALIRLVAAGG